MHHIKKTTPDSPKYKDANADGDVVWKSDHTGASVLKPKVRSQEDKDNIEAAILYAQATGCVVRLQRACNTGKSADAMVGGKRLEIKTIRTATKSAVAGALRKAASGQTQDVLVNIKVFIAEGELKEAIYNRVRRKNYLQTVTVITHKGEVTTYKREEILEWKKE